MAANRPPDGDSRGARDADDAALHARLRRLGERLGTLKPKPREPEEETGSLAENPSNLAQGLRLSSEFIAGILVGGFIGWLIDRFAGTSPWGLIVFLLLGFGAGILNMLRVAGIQGAQGHERDKK
jgi:ATP synthase protein I